MAKVSRRVPMSVLVGAKRKCCAQATLLQEKVVSTQHFLFLIRENLQKGPNMVSLNSAEVNFIAYGWDEDNKAAMSLRCFVLRNHSWENEKMRL